MKLRLRGDSVRLRLTQTDVATLVERGHVEQSVHFGPNPEQALRYGLWCDEETAPLRVRYEREAIAVMVPRGRIVAWAANDEVAITAKLDVGEGRTLEVLIEKDFQCLIPRGEVDGDAFPNPRASGA